MVKVKYRGANTAGIGGQDIFYVTTTWDCCAYATLAFDTQTTRTYVVGQGTVAKTFDQAQSNDTYCIELYELRDKRVGDEELS